jgi:acylphosphatase
MRTVVDFVSGSGVLAEDMGTGLVRVRVLAGGRVQGVAYRFYAEKYAARLNITGWVRNLEDGRVEVLAEGTSANIETFLERLEVGPSLAHVDTFDVRHEPSTGEFRDFRIVFLSD